MIWLLDEGVLALQAGTYRRLSAGYTSWEMGSAARVEALAGHRHMAEERLLNASQAAPPQRHVLGIFRSRLVLRCHGCCAMQLCGSKERGVMFVILVWFAERFNRMVEMLTLYFGPCV